MLKLFGNKEKEEEGTGDEGAKKKRSASNPQGISAGRNALGKIIVIGLLVVLVPTALGFSYLILLREPAVKHKQLSGCRRPSPASRPPTCTSC